MQKIVELHLMKEAFSPLSNTKLSLDTWLKYCRFMIKGGTIKYCAQQVSISIPTSFLCVIES